MEGDKIEKIIKFIDEEADRIQYGKIHIEITVTKGNAVNIKGTPERSKRIDC